MVGETFPLGAGELTIGATASPIDISCLVNNAVIAASKDQGDSETKLCGTVKVPKPTYTYELSGNMDTDIGDPTGFFALSQASPGEQFDFSFTPNSDAGTAATGVLIVDPLDFGGDTTGETMKSDFTFTIVGEPVYTFGGGVVVTAGATDEDERDEDEVA
jgi:hypothetical protein